MTLTRPSLIGHADHLGCGGPLHVLVCVAAQATALHRSMEGGPRGRFQQQVLQFAHGSIATTIVVRTNQGSIKT